MLKKTNKLTSLEINNLFLKDTPIKIERGVFFDIKYLLKKDLKREEIFKTGVVAPVKVFKKAVDRNKIRRQIYSILEKYKKELESKNIQIFLIFYIKKTIKNIKFSILEKEVYNILNNIIKNQK